MVGGKGISLLALEQNVFGGIATPTAPMIGDLWYDETAALWKKCTDTSPVTFVSIEGSGGAATITVQEEGVTQSATVTTLNFTGAGVTASGGGAVATIDVPGGGGGVPTSRLINTAAPLAGGGDLTADRTITTSMNTNKLIGRGSGGVGVMEEITLGTNLSLSGTTLNASGGAGASWTEAEVDFGSSPVYDAVFTITDGAVSSGSKIIVVQSGKAATGRIVGDEQWDSVIYGASPGTGDFDLYAIATPGPVVGKRTIQYTIG